MRNRSNFQVFLLLVSLPGFADGAARAFSEYASSPTADSSISNLRRFRHHEKQELDDGTALKLGWEADVDPATILAVDVEQLHGVRVLRCQPDRLVLQVTTAHVREAARWRHVTASSHLHSCTHLKENHLYHQVVELRDIWPMDMVQKYHAVTLITKELQNPAHIFPRCSFVFELVHSRARATRVDAEPEGVAGKRRLSALALPMDAFMPHLSKNVLGVNLTGLIAPTELKDLGWNWDFQANTTKNKTFKFDFAGGDAELRLYAPYLKAHVSIWMNYTSTFKSLAEGPQVKINAEVSGIMDFNLDMGAIVNFRRDRAVMLDRTVTLPGQLGSEMLTMLKFDMGGIPFTLRPEFNCGLQAYHKGTMVGSIRALLAADLLFTAHMSLDTIAGLHSNLSVKVQNLKALPPRWMLNTNYFELGVMLKPSLCMLGGFDEENHMSMCLNARPYFNMSYHTGNSTSLAATSTSIAALGIYPFRAIGLPNGKDYAIRVAANNVIVTTSTQMSTGVVEFFDSPGRFDFGDITEVDLLSTAIEVSVIEDGKDAPVATGTARCQGMLDHFCSPRPVVAEMKVEGQQVTVQLDVAWHDFATDVLESEFRSVTLRFPKVTISEHSAAELHSGKEASLRLTRSGQVYSAPLEADSSGNTTVFEGKTVYEFGPCFKSSWSLPPSGGALETYLTTTIDLVVGNRTVASGHLPPIEVAQSPHTEVGGDKAPGKAFTVIPVTVPLYGSDDAFVGTVQVLVDARPASEATFWVSPSSARSFPVGQTESFSWVLYGSEEGVEYDFNLTAIQVSGAEDGAQAGWKQRIKATCTPRGGGLDDGFDAGRYIGGARPCVFAYDVQIPDSALGHRVVMVVSWKDVAGRQHEMVSAPVDYVNTSQSLKRAVSSGGVAKSRRNHSKGMRECEQPSSVKYSINAGLYLADHTKNAFRPTGLGDAMWSTEPWKIDTIDDTSFPSWLSSVCPMGMCDASMAGTCEPLDPDPDDIPLEIPRIVFKLSRHYKWEDEVTPELHTAIAYGLALLPSAVEVLSGGPWEPEEAPPAAPAAAAPPPSVAPEEVGGRATGRGAATTEEAPARPGGSPKLRRRLAPGGPGGGGGGGGGAPGAEEEEEEEQGVRELTVRIKGPVPYMLDERLLGSLVSSGAFRLEDGREATHGPLHITGFELQGQSSGTAEFAQKAELLEGAGSSPVAEATSRPSAFAALVLAAWAVGMVALGALSYRRHAYSRVSQGGSFAEHARTTA